MEHPTNSLPPSIGTLNSLHLISTSSLVLIISKTGICGTNLYSTGGMSICNSIPDGQARTDDRSYPRNRIPPIPTYLPTKTIGKYSPIPAGRRPVSYSPMQQTIKNPRAFRS